MVEVSEVDTNFLKNLLPPLVLAEVEPVEQADTEIENPVEDEIDQHSLVDTSLPEAEQSEEGEVLGSADVVDVGHCHPQQPHRRGVFLIFCNTNINYCLNIAKSIFTFSSLLYSYYILLHITYYFTTHITRSKHSIKKFKTNRAHKPSQFIKTITRLTD